MKKAWQQLRDQDNRRPLPFANATPGRFALSVDAYGKKIDDWFAKVRDDKEHAPPTEEQWTVLRRIRDRVLLEYGIEKEGRDTRRECDEEPLRGLVHGPPGSGKSELIKYIRRFFEEALGWTHGVEFMFVAYQNKVAHAMNGMTIHAAGCLNMAQQVCQLSHTDVDVAFTKNQDLRRVLIDEIGMVSDHLLGCFATALDDASNRSKRFLFRQGGQRRILGG